MIKDENAAELAKVKRKEENLQRTSSDLQCQADKNFFESQKEGVCVAKVLQRVL